MRAYAIPAAAPDSPPTALDGVSWLVPLWMAGVLVCYVRIFIGWLAALRLRRRGVCAAPEVWQSRLDKLAVRLKLSRPVVLLESCLADVPVVIGWFRPVILAPLGVLAGLSESQVEAILVHELAHIRRYDYAVNLLQGFVEGLLFYHPAVWWISRLVRAERENCCDDVVIAHCPDARAYAAALATLEQNRPIAGEAVLAATGGNLMKRIHRLLQEPQRADHAVAPALAVGLLLIVVAGSISAMTASRFAGRPVALATTPGASPALPVATPQQQKQAPQKAAAADIPQPYRSWLNEDVVYIITKEERAAFLALKTDGDRDDFIKQFWEQRDPTPGTAANEYKDEHYRRIAYANERFSENKAGWKTDRGRIYIIYGPPDEIEAHPHAGNYTRPPEEGGGTIFKCPFEQWRYRYIEGVGKDVIIEFDDTKSTGEYKMTRDPLR